MEPAFPFHSGPVPPVPPAHPGLGVRQTKPLVGYAGPISVVLPLVYFVFSFVIFLGSRTTQQRPPPQVFTPQAPTQGPEDVQRIMRDTAVALGAGLIPAGIAAAIVGLVGGARQRQPRVLLPAVLGLVLNVFAGLVWLAVGVFPTRGAPTAPPNAAGALPGPGARQQSPWATTGPWDAQSSSELPQRPPSMPGFSSNFSAWPGQPSPSNSQPPTAAPTPFLRPSTALDSPSQTDFTALPTTPEAKAAAGELQGQWQKVTIEKGGRVVNVEAQQILCTFEGNRLTDAGLLSPTTVSEFRVDPNGDPKHFDERFTGGTIGPWISQGIYRLEGETLTICRGGVNVPRPTGFSTRPTDGRTISVYRRMPRR